ncbi:hypothetical protein [Paenibacillus sp. NPDC057934]|uniref:hypothetical protein n=1 Tax=Paenibacillus sp. NPDC057934 TaxID=3346282 RepID=UPI0036D7F5F1
MATVCSNKEAHQEEIKRKQRVLGEDLEVVSQKLEVYNNIEKGGFVVIKDLALECTLRCKLELLKNNVHRNKKAGETG